MAEPEAKSKVYSCTHYVISPPFANQNSPILGPLITKQLTCAKNKQNRTKITTQNLWKNSHQKTPVFLVMSPLSAVPKKKNRIVKGVGNPGASDQTLAGGGTSMGAIV